MHILKNINDFNTFFDYVGLPKKTTANEFDTLFKTAIKNSENKKYHG